MDNVPFPYDLQLAVYLHLLIYLLLKDHDGFLNNNNKNNNIMTFKYDFYAITTSARIIFNNIVLMVLRLQVDRVGEKIVVVVVVAIIVLILHHYVHSHHSRRRRCRSCISTPS